MGGGAWPFLVGGVICLVNSDNERDSSLLTRRHFDLVPVSTGGGVAACRSRFPGVGSDGDGLLRGTSALQAREIEQ